MKKVLSVLIAVVVMVGVLSPVGAKAQTTGELQVLYTQALQTLIQLLIQQVAELRQQLANIEAKQNVIAAQGGVDVSSVPPATSTPSQTEQQLQQVGPTVVQTVPPVPTPPPPAPDAWWLSIDETGDVSDQTREPEVYALNCLTWDGSFPISLKMASKMYQNCSKEQTRIIDSIFAVEGACGFGGNVMRHIFWEYTKANPLATASVSPLMIKIDTYQPTGMLPKPQVTEAIVPQFTLSPSLSQFIENNLESNLHLNNWISGGFTAGKKACLEKARIQ